MEPSSLPHPVSATSIVEALRSRARLDPAGEAFAFLPDGEVQEVCLTYAQLDLRARALAARLQSTASRTAHVLVMLPPGVDYPAALYGGFYAGNAVVPFSPPQQGQGVGPVEDAVIATGASVILTTTPIRETLDEAIGQSPILRDLAWLLTDAVEAGAEDAWVHPELTPDTRATLWLTSGTTGRPKGTIRSHGALMQLLEPWLALADALPGGRVVSFLPPSLAMASMMNHLLPVVGGIPATIMPTAAFLERPARWLEAISRSGPAYSAAPNFAYDLCVDAVTPGERASLDLASWQLAYSGGEMLRPQTTARFARAFAPCGFNPRAFCTGYGMTECLGIASHPPGSALVARAFNRHALEHRQVLAATHDDGDARMLVSVGQPGAGVTCEIVDPSTGIRCAPDGIGEIWASSPGAAEGYLDRPEETGAVFGGYLADTGDGPYVRTGDLGFMYGGELYVTGRIKEIMIIRGRNIAPEGVELVVQQSHHSLRPGAGAAFSIDTGDEERLFVVHEVNADTQDFHNIFGAMRQAVATRYEIQAHGVVLVPPGTIPRTSGGKIQRLSCRAACLENRLPVLARHVLGENAQRSVATAYVAPQAGAEAALVTVWRDTLRVSDVGVDDNYFALGGDSLLSMQMIARLRQAGWQLELDQLLAHPTIAELAPVLVRAVPIASRQETVAGLVPLTPRQHRHLELTDPARYHIRQITLLVTRASLDPGLFQQAVRGIVDHHDALRMRFSQHGGEWRQVNLAREDQQVFSYTDVSTLPADDRHQVISGITAEIRNGLRLDDGPLVRFALIHTGAGKDVVVAGWNHLIMDAFSIRIMLEDLGRAYEQLSRGEAMQLAPRTTSFKAWAERLVQYASSPDAREELAYWLDDVRRDVVPLPVDATHGGAAGACLVSLDCEETDMLLHDVPKMHGTGINDVLLTAVVKAFATWTGSRSLLVNVMGHGRGAIFPGVDLSRTVGFLSADFPILLDLGNANGIGEELQRIEEQLRAIPNGGVGYGVWRYLGRDQDVVERLAQQAEPQVAFNYIGQFDHLYADSLVFEDPYRYTPAHFNFDAAGAKSLVIAPRVVQGRMQVTVQSGVVVHERATLEYLANAYIDALRAIIASTRATVVAS